MIKKLKIGLLITILSLFVSASSANAAVLTYTDDTVVKIGGQDYVIESGSGATSVTINAANTTLVALVPTSTTFTLSSYSGFTLTNVDDAGTPVTTTQTCSNGVNTVAYTGTGASVTFTPTTVVKCSSGNSSGGGSSADATAPTGTSISVGAGATSTTSTAVTLTLAATGATQMMISNDSGFAGASWETYATSKAWTLVTGDGVKTVYAKFKDAAGNASTSVSDTITLSGSGTVAPPVVPSVPTEGCSGGNLYNPNTGALCVNNAGAEIPGCGNRNTGFSSASGISCVGNRVITLPPSTSPASPVSTGPYNFGTTTLKNGSKGEAVKELQKFLNTKLNLGLVVDGKLGPKTIKVIKQWQKDNGLVADGLIGPKTKVKMNASVQ